jgi:peptidoglycan glycosyltransferase
VSFAIAASVGVSLTVLAVPPRELASSGSPVTDPLQPSASSAPTDGSLYHLHVDPRLATDNMAAAFETPFGQIRWADVKDRIVEREGGVYLDHAGYRLELTLDPELHDSINKRLNRERRVGAAVVILDNRSGAILGLADRQGDPGNPLATIEDRVAEARAPAASLMKIITAAAAIEKSGVEPSEDIPFRGGCQFLRRRNWLRDRRADTIKMSLAQAFGHSCNTAFARLAIYNTGLASLREYADRFFMNRPIPSDMVLETSLAALPQLDTATAYDVGEAGAGFGFSKLNPVHATLLSAAVANHGKLMAPHLVKRAFDANGKLVYEAQPREIGTVMSPSTAEKMMELMKATVRSGTSRRHFLRRSTREQRGDIGGKTGTLKDMEDRKTLYTWFTGIGPGSGPEESVSVGVLVASPTDWLVRASSVAQDSLGQFYYVEKMKKRVARGHKN